MVQEGTVDQWRNMVYAPLSDDEEGTIDTADVDEAKQTTNQDTNKASSITSHKAQDTSSKERSGGPIMPSTEGENETAATPEKQPQGVYQNLHVDGGNVPDCYEITIAIDDDGVGCHVAVYRKKLAQGMIRMFHSKEVRWEYTCKQWDSLQEHKDGFNTWGFSQSVVDVREENDCIVFADASNTSNITLPRLTR